MISNFLLFVGKRQNQAKENKNSRSVEAEETEGSPALACAPSSGQKGVVPPGPEGEDHTVNSPSDPLPPADPPPQRESQPRLLGREGLGASGGV